MISYKFLVPESNLKKKKKILFNPLLNMPYNEYHFLGLLHLNKLIHKTCIIGNKTSSFKTGRTHSHQRENQLDTELLIQKY